MDESSYEKKKAKLIDIVSACLNRSNMQKINEDFFILFLSARCSILKL